MTLEAPGGLIMTGALINVLWKTFSCEGLAMYGNSDRLTMYSKLLIRYMAVIDRIINSSILEVQTVELQRPCSADVTTQYTVTVRVKNMSPLDFFRVHFPYTYLYWFNFF